MKFDARRIARIGMVLSTFAACGAASLAAQAPVLQRASELLGAAAYNEVLGSGKAVAAGEGGQLTLLPAHPAAAPVRAAFAAEKPGLLVEAAFMIPRVAPAGQAAREAELAAIYGHLGSFSSMEGIKYWSVSHKAWRTFYAQSYRVDGAETKRRLADPPAPRPGAVPAEDAAIVYQRDLSFGGNLYRYSFRSYADAASLESSNLTAMSLGPLPVIAAGSLKTRLVAIQGADAIVFYVACGADAPAVFRSRLAESFGNRAEALFRWFEARAGSQLGR